MLSTCVSHITSTRIYDENKARLFQQHTHVRSLRLKALFQHVSNSSTFTASLHPPPGTPPALSSRPPPLPLVASIAGRSASWVCCLEAPERPGWPRQTRSSVLSEKRDTKRKQLVSFHLSRHVCSVRKQKNKLSGNTRNIQRVEPHIYTHGVILPLIITCLHEKMKTLCINCVCNCAAPGCTGLC